MLRKLSFLVLMGGAVSLLSGCPPPPAGNTPTPPPPANTAGNAPAGNGPPVKLSGTLKIGHFASMTGNTAMFGKATDDGVKLAIEELKAAGLDAESQTLDDASQQQQAPIVVNRLISQFGATAIVGEVASSRSIAAAPICDSQQVPMVSPSSTNPDVTVDPRTHETHPYVFRVCFTDPFQGAVIARFVKDNLKKTKAVILKDTKQAYSVGLADGFKKKFTAIGGTVVSEESYSEGDSDFRGQLTRIKGMGAEVLVVPGYYREAGLIVKQARTLGLNVPVIGGDGWDSPTLTDVGVDYFKDCYFSNHFSPEEQRPGVQEFVKAFKSKNGEAPNALCALGYDAVKIVADAAKRAGSLDRKAIRDQLEQTKNYPGVTGQITIDKDHNAVKSAVVVSVKNQGGQARFALETTIAP